MLKKTIVCFTIVLALAGCRKEDNPILLITNTIPDPAMHPRPSRPMVKTITSTGYQGSIITEYFYYDTLWRLTKHIRHNTNYPPYQPTTYVDSFFYHPTYIGTNSWQAWSLNPDGLAYRDNGTNYSQRFYSYNANPNMINEHSMSGSSDYIYDSNGNMIEHHNQTEANPPNYIYYHYYYTYNNHLNTIGNYNKGKYHFGKSSVNLIEREDWYFYLNTPYDSMLNFNLYSYTYNDSGWVSRKDVNSAQINRTQIDSVTVLYDTIYQLSHSDYTYY